MRYLFQVIDGNEKAGPLLRCVLDVVCLVEYDDAVGELDVEGWKGRHVEQVIVGEQQQIRHVFHPARVKVGAELLGAALRLELLDIEDLVVELLIRVQVKSLIVVAL